MGISVTKDKLLNEPLLDEEEETQEEEFEEEKVYSQEDMLERGSFTANGYTFTVKPVTLFESMDFRNSGIYVPAKINEFGEEYSDRELGIKLSLLFMKENSSEEEQSSDESVKQKESFWDKIKSKFNKSEEACLNYDDYPRAKNMIYWMEKKIFIDGKPIKFHELETKYMLTKGEIAKMLIYLFEMSGF